MKRGVDGTVIAVPVIQTGMHDPQQFEHSSRVPLEVVVRAAAHDVVAS
jgi:hypothetical protein